MSYTDLTLFVFCLGGTFLHCLIKIDAIKKDPNLQTISLLEYIKKEWTTITISLVLGALCIRAKHEIVQLEKVGDWLGFGFTAIGYMGQSIFISLMGKAQKVVDNISK